MFENPLNIHLVSPAVRHTASDDRRKSRIGRDTASDDRRKSRIGRDTASDDRRKSRIVRHHDSSVNFNTVRYIENNRPVPPWPIRGNVHYSIDYSGIGEPTQMPNSQINSDFDESQLVTFIRPLSPPAQVRRISKETINLSNLRLADSVDSVATWLQASLEELEECPNQASEEGLEQPSKVGLSKAIKFLENLSAYVTERPDIYPMDEGSIAIDFRGSEKMSGVLFLVEKDGSGAIFHRTKTTKGRLRVDDADYLIQEGGLSELKRVGIR